MSNSPAELLRKWLISNGLATDPADGGDWSAYVASMPETPSKAICVYDAPGVLQGRIQATGETIVTFGAEVRVRAGDYATGRSRASDICDAFDAIRNAPVTLDDHDFVIAAVTRKSSILHLGPEANNKRELFTIKFLASIREA